MHYANVIEPEQTNDGWAVVIDGIRVRFRAMMETKRARGWLGLPRIVSFNESMESEQIGNIMQTFNLNDLVSESERTGQRWREFLRAPSLSMGVYRLKAGQADEQQPHGEDEVYVVLSGRASFWAGGRVQAVATNSVIFVERNVEHRFVDITEDLTVLVFFAPSEGSLKDGGTK